MQEQKTITRSTYSAGGQAIATRVSGDPESDNNGLFYFHSDHLGSATFLTHGNGHTNEGDKVANSTKFYTPFGEYRIQPPNPTDDITDRGYTGHKHNDYIKLIYMGARYYLPSVGRFISADSIVPDPANPQSYNRYSYTLNNPIKYVDPTGHYYCVSGDDCSIPQQVKAGTLGLIENLSVWNPVAITEPRVSAPTDSNMTSWLVEQIKTAVNGEVYAVLNQNLRSTPARYAGAILAWTALVRQGGIWDFKVDIKDAGIRFEKDGQRNLITLGNHDLNFQVVANIFFGFVGKSLGFTEEFLLWGAAAEQFKNTRRIGDDPIDVWAIQFGFYLYELYGDDVDSLTEEAFNEALDAYIEENPPPIPDHPGA